MHTGGSIESWALVGRLAHEERMANPPVFPEAGHQWPTNKERETDMNFRTRLGVGLATAGMIVIATGGVAFAGNDYDVPSQIPSTAQCGSGAGSGAFGAFGKGNNLAGGANGPLTGLSNSSICGNR